MSIDQVVTRQIHRGVMHGVNEVGLHHGVVGVLHGVGCVDDVHLERESKNVPSTDTRSYSNAGGTVQALFALLGVLSHTSTLKSLLM